MNNFDLPHVFMSYKHGDDFEIVRFFSNQLRERSIKTYIDVDFEPVNDPDGLAVGLSEGLGTTPILISFVSAAYLESRWCLEELRNFIYANGRRMSEEEMKNKFYWSSEGQRILLMMEPHPIPVIFIALEKQIDCKAISRALAVKSGAQMIDDSNRRITLARGPEDSKYYDDSIAYLRVKGIDASVYVEDIPILDIQTLSPEILVQKLVELIKEWLKSTIEAKNSRQIIQNARLTWTNILRQYGIHASLIDKYDLVNDALSRLPDKRLFDLSVIGAKNNPFIFNLLRSIQLDIPTVSVFNRRLARSHSLRRLVDYDIYVGRTPDSLQQFIEALKAMREFIIKDDLRLVIITGTPLEILFMEAIESDIIFDLQNSYYFFTAQFGRHELVDAAVVACLAINVDLAFESLQDWNLFKELILDPFTEQKDIRSQFPGEFRSTTMAQEYRDVEERYHKLKLSSDNSRRIRQALE